MAVQSTSGARPPHVGKVVGGETHWGDTAVWRWREAVGAMEFNGGEAPRQLSATSVGSGITKGTRGR
jgi:hypothetical protein